MILLSGSRAPLLEALRYLFIQGITEPTCQFPLVKAFQNCFQLVFRLFRLSIKEDGVSFLYLYAIRFLNPVVQGIPMFRLKVNQVRRVILIEALWMSHITYAGGQIFSIPNCIRIQVSE